MWMTMTLVEGLTLQWGNHWTWESHLLGMRITDEFGFAEDAHLLA